MNPSSPNAAEPPQISATVRYAGCAVMLLRLAADMLFTFLLAGYLIFNRSFASLGFPPFYAGEIALSVAILAALFDLKGVFFEPLKYSWPLRLIVAFFLYGAACVCFDAPQSGIFAARDGVICLYSVAAFLVPWLLVVSPYHLRSGGIMFEESPSPLHGEAIRRLLWIVERASIPAVAWGWMIYFGWITAPRTVKVDFLTLSAAVACIYFSMRCLTLILMAMRPPRPENDSQRRAKTARKIRVWLPLSLVMCAVSFPLLFLLPTRSVQFAVIIVALFFAAMVFIEFRPRNTWHLSLCVAALLAMTGGAGCLASRSPAVREKIATILDPNDAHFETRQGQVSAHSVKWRMVFWRRCIDETWRRAPVFGLGFGTNLTELLRDTPDWPMFEDSQNAAKYGSPNRHPHSAHVTVFTRLGFVGALLWFALLSAVFIQGIQNCRRAREFILEGREPTRRLRLIALFGADTTILAIWMIYVIAMSFGVVLENPFGGIWFWTLTGVIANRRE